MQRPRVVASHGRVVLSGCRQKSSRGRMYPWKAQQVCSEAGGGNQKGHNAIAQEAVLSGLRATRLEQ